MMNAHIHPARAVDLDPRSGADGVAGAHAAATAVVVIAMQVTPVAALLQAPGEVGAGPGRGRGRFRATVAPTGRLRRAAVGPLHGSRTSVREPAGRKQGNAVSDG